MEPDRPLFDFENTYYCEWEANSRQWSGMRNKITGAADGIVRIVKDDGEILEASFKSDGA